MEQGYIDITTPDDLQTEKFNDATTEKIYALRRDFDNENYEPFEIKPIVDSGDLVDKDDYILKYNEADCTFTATHFDPEGNAGSGNSDLNTEDFKDQTEGYFTLRKLNNEDVYRPSRTIGIRNNEGENYVNSAVYNLIYFGNNDTFDLVLHQPDLNTDGFTNASEEYYVLERNHNSNVFNPLSSFPIIRTQGQNLPVGNSYFLTAIDNNRLQLTLSQNLSGSSDLITNFFTNTDTLNTYALRRNGLGNPYVPVEIPRVTFSQFRIDRLNGVDYVHRYSRDQDSYSLQETIIVNIPDPEENDANYILRYNDTANRQLTPIRTSINFQDFDNRVVHGNGIWVFNRPDIGGLISPRRIPLIQDVFDPQISSIYNLQLVSSNPDVF